MGPAGVWGRGLSRPQRRDLQGPIDHIPVKPLASDIPAPPGLGTKSWLGEAVASKIIAPLGQSKNFQLGETESFKLCACPGRAKED